MILYSTNSIKNSNGESSRLIVTGPQQNELKVYDTNTEILLRKIVDQLQITNTHLSFLSDNYLDEADID